MDDDDQNEYLEQFLDGEGGNESQKLDVLIGTVENIEDEYKNREKQRINDLQMIINNLYSTKGVLRYVRDYDRRLDKKIKDMEESLIDVDKKIDDLTSDSAVLEKRYINFRNNVVGQAEECQWEMDKLFKLLENDNYSEDEDDTCADDDDDHFLDIKHTEIGSLGLQLTQTKKAIDSQNKALDEFANIFQQIRYGHSMQYHHNKDEYVNWRKTVDLAGDEERLFTKKFIKQHSRGSSLSSIGSGILSSDDNIGMILDLDIDLDVDDEKDSV